MFQLLKLFIKTHLRRLLFNTFLITLGASLYAQNLKGADGEATYFASVIAVGPTSKTPSGFHNRIIKEGNGANPTLADSVRVFYKNTLLYGTIFDCVPNTAKPVSFRLSSVIPRWAKSIQFCRAGGTIQMFISAALAYGNVGNPPTIAPKTARIVKIIFVSSEPTNPTIKPE